MLAKLAAGESPTNVCIDKYRQLYCKVQSGEKIEQSDIRVNTCALCYKYFNIGCNDGLCPLFKTGDGCLDKKDSPYRILAHLLSDYEYNDVAWDKEKVLTAIEGMIVALKKAQKYKTEQTEKDTYIEGEKNCGLKVGDKVKVFRVATDHEQGWKNAWLGGESMSANKTGTITKIEHSSGKGIRVKVDDIFPYKYLYFVLEKVEEKTYHVGQHFLYNNRNEYLLARIERNKVNLFNLSSGGKWGSHTTVSDDDKITEEEMKKLANRLHQWKDFELIE